MNTEHVVPHRILDTLSSSWRRAIALASFVLLAAPSPAWASSSGAPLLTDVEAPDLLGESRIWLRLDLDEAVIGIDGESFTVDRAIEIDFADLDMITLVLELPEGSTGWSLFVTRDGSWTETISTTSNQIVITLWPGSTVELELAMPGQTRPIKPLVVLQPTPKNPTP